MQLARLVGANPIIALDLEESVRDRALEIGADFAFDSRDPDLQAKIAELAAAVAADHDVDTPPLLVCVLKGAAMFLTDFARLLADFLADVAGLRGGKL